MVILYLFCVCVCLCKFLMCHKLAMQICCCVQCRRNRKPNVMKTKFYLYHLSKVKLVDWNMRLLCRRFIVLLLMSKLYANILCLCGLVNEMSSKVILIRTITLPFKEPWRPVNVLSSLRYCT